MLGLILGGLSAAGSLLSGLGARSSAKSQQRQQDARNEQARLQNAWTSAEMMNDVPRRIAGDAEIAGFNPVTWLQGGALGFYSNAYSMRMVNPGQAINIPSVTSAIGGALSAGVDAFATQNRFDQKLEFEGSQLDKQLGALKYGMGRPSRAGVGMAALSGAGGAIYGAGSSGGAGGLSFGKLPKNQESGLAELGAPYGLRVDPREPDQEAVSRRQGDFWGEVQGTFNKYNDAYFRATGGLTLRNLESDAWKWANRGLDVLAKTVPKHPYVFDMEGAMSRVPSQRNNMLRNPGNIPWSGSGM